MLVVDQNDWSDMKRLAAAPANGRLTLQVLNEPIREVIGSARTTGGLIPVGAALGASEFDAVELRIAVYGGATSVAKSNCFKCSVDLVHRPLDFIHRDLDAGLSRSDAFLVTVCKLFNVSRLSTFAVSATHLLRTE